jgi:hypothetical protein
MKEERMTEQALHNAPARLVSIGVTALLLGVLDIGRGIIGRKNVALTAIETLAIAAATAAAGLLIGKLVPGHS